MDALCLNVDRHTQNYGVLQNRSNGTIVGMTPNFDNNIALISRGYGPDMRQTNEFLLDLFEEFLKERGLRIPRPSWMRNPFGKSRVRLFLTRILTEAMCGNGIARPAAGRKLERLQRQDSLTLRF